MFLLIFYLHGSYHRLSCWHPFLSQISCEFLSSLLFYYNQHNQIDVTDLSWSWWCFVHVKMSFPFLVIKSWWCFVYVNELSFVFMLWSSFSFAKRRLRRWNPGAGLFISYINLLYQWKFRIHRSCVWISIPMAAIVPDTNCVPDFDSRLWCWT